MAQLYMSPLDALRRHSERRSQAEERQQLKNADDLESITSLSTAEVFAARVPRRGFLLRLVANSAGLSGSVCSRCPWLSRCSGCTLPDSSLLLSLLDGETIAVDFHHLVAKELLPYSIPSLPPPHDSLLSSLPSPSSTLPGTTILLSSCFEKFSESELLPDFHCPRCKERAGEKKEGEDSYGQVSRFLTLSCLPPLLILHLKRFQWVPGYGGSGGLGTGRWRKLSPRVSFPLTSLDLASFMRPHDKCCSEDAVAATSSTPPLYDLYAVIHHMGALGGGHYIATIKVGCDEKSVGTMGALPSSLSLSSHSETTSGGNGITDRKKGLGSWYIFNDNLVTPIPEPAEGEVTASSAYLLFYIRRDFLEFKEGEAMRYLLDVLQLKGDVVNQPNGKDTASPDKINNDNAAFVVGRSSNKKDSAEANCNVQ